MLFLFNRRFNSILIICLILIFFQKSHSKKDILDYSEAELDKLYEQWNENDPEEENEEQNRPKTVPPIDLNSLRENVCF